MSNAKRLEEISKELRSVQSAKHRLNKQKLRKDYEQKIKEVTAKENALQVERRQLQPLKSTVTTITDEEISLLSFDETVKAIKSIQSKKCNTQYDEDLTEHKSALAIEEKLIAHRASMKPGDRRSIAVSQLQELLEVAATSTDEGYIADKLKELIDSKKK
jgi:seryl-tRNA synthetase